MKCKREKKSKKESVVVDSVATNVSEQQSVDSKPVTSAKTKKSKRERKIGRFFNPLVRIMQYGIDAFVSYWVVMATATSFLPVMGTSMGRMIIVGDVSNIVIVMLLWAIPYLFVAAFLFVAELIFIKWFVRKMKHMCDSLIERYRKKQEAFFDEAKSDSSDK